MPESTFLQNYGNPKLYTPENRLKVGELLLTKVN